MLLEYLEVFVHNGFDRMETIQRITQQDLEFLGVKKGHIKLILDALYQPL